MGSEVTNETFKERLMRKMLFVLTLLACMAGAALAQMKTVSGTVLSAKDKRPLPGVTVRAKSSAKYGALTSIDGKFSFTVPSSEAKLLFSYIGMKKQEVDAGVNLKVIMHEDSEVLDEVVVIGYTTKSVANTSASVVKVSAKDLQEKPTANIMEAAQGKVSGLQVYTSSGEPSQISSVKLHGVGSLEAGSTPLYILDGMPVSETTIRSLNQNDFESMQFLKDAAATSIYGARAANGVVYIQTKKGRMAERATITFRGQYGVSTLANSQYYDRMMNTEELLSFWKETQMYNDATLDAIRDKYGKNDTKWWKYFYQNAPTYQADITVRGGSRNTNYYISGGIFNQEGLRAGSEYSKMNIRANLNSTLNDVIKLGLNSSVSYDKSRRSPNSFARGETYAALQMMLNPPFYTPYKENGEEYYDEPIPGLGFYNPKYSMDNDINTGESLFLNLLGNVTITPFKNFQIRSNVGLELVDGLSERLQKPSWVKTAGNGYRYMGFGRDITFTSNNIAEYKFNVGEDNHFTTLVGHEFVDYKYKGFNAKGKGLNDDRLVQLAHTTEEKNVGESSSEYAFLSYFGQFSYDYQKKYFLDLVLRNDASSRFGKNKRNGLFWSAGLLWKSKKEDFLTDVDWVNKLDLKASYGTQGNAAIDNYEALATTGTYGQYKGTKGWVLVNPGNPDLTWESQSKFTIGLSARLFDRLGITLEFYNRLTHDMLMDVPQPFSNGLAINRLGFATIKSNVGKYQNRGIDLSLTADLLQGKDYGISAYLNLNYNRDKVLELFQGRDSWILPGFGFGYIVGKPVSFIYPVFKDINPENGLPRWYIPATMEKNGEKVFDPKVSQFDDKKLTSQFSDALEQNTGKSRYPHTTGGFGLSANWKGLALQADFAFVLGKYMITNESFFTQNPLTFSRFNTDRAVKDYWKKKGDHARYPSLAYQRQTYSVQFDSRLLDNASFMRMKNLTIGYTFQKNLLGKQKVIKGLKIYGTARNLFTITKYNGHDPEVDSNLSWLTNPNTRQFIVGMELMF